MSDAKICDLCNKRIEGPNDYELKIRKRISGWAESWWTKVDAHKPCVDALLKAKYDRENPCIPIEELHARIGNAIEVVQQQELIGSDAQTALLDVWEALKGRLHDK